MRAMYVNGGQPPGLMAGERARPHAAPGEVLVEVRAAGVMLTELGWYPTTHNRSGGQRTGAVPSHEFSGVVIDGDGVIGSQVFGMNDWYTDGAMADYCTAPVTAIAKKPKSLTHAESAAVPISALTAWQGLVDRAKVQRGDRVLIHGGAGAVGVFAIQVAVLQSAHVTATASADDRDFVLSLGAEQAIDYRTAGLNELAGMFDVVFDTVGGETLQRSWDLLAPGGRVVTVASTAEQSTDPRVRQSFFIVEGDGRQLDEIGMLIDGGKLRPVIKAVVAMGDLPNLYAGQNIRRGPGKMVALIGNQF